MNLGLAQTRDHVLQFCDGRASAYVRLNGSQHATDAEWIWLGYGSKWSVWRFVKHAYHPMAPSSIAKNPQVITNYAVSAIQCFVKAIQLAEGKHGYREIISLSFRLSSWGLSAFANALVRPQWEAGSFWAITRPDQDNSNWHLAWGKLKRFKLINFKL